MTTRNLNGNWIDTLRRQYAQDLQDDCPHPIKYLLWNPQKQRDLYYLIPKKIEEQQLRRALVKYHQATKGTPTVEWESEYVKVSLHPRYSTEAFDSHQQVNSTDEIPPTVGSQSQSQ